MTRIVAKEKRCTQRRPGERRNRKTEANQRHFVEEYLANGRNGTQAYLKVYPRCTAEAARRAASRLLTNVDVQEYLAQREAELMEQLNVNQLSVLEGLKRLAFFDIRKLFNEDGSLKQPHELDDETAAALASIEVEELFEGRGENREQIGYRKKIKMADRGQNLERMMRWLGMFKDKDQSPGSMPFPSRVTVKFVKAKAAQG